MKLHFHLVLVCCLAVVSGLPVVANDDFETIDAELIDRAVVIQLPEGVRRIRLRIHHSDGTWEIRTIAHLEGTEGYLKLRLPDGVDEEDIELAASWTDPFHYDFYKGKTTFDPTQTDSNTNRDATAVPGGGVLEDTTSESTVEESDIWKWRGSTLYFFNQYRGLQLIDVADPAKSGRLATLRMPFSGEQLYLHPTEDVVALLTYDSNAGNGQVVLVDHTSTDELEQSAAIPLPGYIVESRMVGSILYVVSRRWWQESIIDPDTSVEHLRSRSGLAVSKIDLTDPANPVIAEPLELKSDRYDYWGGQVQATSEALLVSTNEYNSALRQSISTVHVVDISNPSVEPLVAYEVPIKGHVLNKFNMQLRERVLTVVSQVWRGFENRQRYASVETFDLSTPSEEPVEALAELEFANNESITASRFAGDLLYVVTVLRIDPLFVISLADPANPQLLGELEIPGFSTYLEPLGEDALISVGVEGSQVAVSWFDVSNPAEPTLASRVFIGDKDGWSWTEANWDEKAFGFFPEDGWILLPYQGYVPEQGWLSGVQMIEMGEQELIKRGSFAHEFQARRARILGEAVVSISGRALKTLDISDPDNPEILAELDLAWPVDFVHRVDDYLIQLERGPSYWYYGSNDSEAKIHVSSTSDMDERVASLELPGGRIVGSLLLDDCLVVAQSEFLSEQDADEILKYTDTFNISIIGLTDPASPEILGTASHKTVSPNYNYGFGADYQGELLPDGSLVWYPAEQNYFFFFGPGIGGAEAGVADFRYPHYPSSGKIYTASINNKNAPQIHTGVSLLSPELSEGNLVSYWPEGKMRLLDSILYYGLQTSEYVELKEGPSQWMARHWLGQLDLEDPASPKIRALVEIPGTFENVVSSVGAGLVLFSSTFNSYYDENIWRNDFRIQALAFDGLKAFLVDELVDEQQGYGPKLFEDNFIVLGKTDYSAGDPITELRTYEWLNSGTFFEHAALQHPGAIYRMGVVDDLLVAPGSGELSFIDFTDPGDPLRTTISFPNLYFWQRVDLIDIFEREFAYLPQGWQGVETLDFDGAFNEVGETFGLPSLQADATPEWVSIGVDLLSITGAVTGILLESLEEDEAWMFADSVEQMSYETWIRLALELPAEEPFPLGGDDFDGDGITNGMEYFTGSHPADQTDAMPVESWLSMETDGTRYLNLRLVLNLHASEAITLIPQYSNDLNEWSVLPEAFEMSEEVFNLAKIIRYLEPVGTGNKQFVRLLLSTENL